MWSLHHPGGIVDSANNPTLISPTHQGFISHGKVYISRPTQSTSRPSPLISSMWRFISQGGISDERALFTKNVADFELVLSGKAHKGHLKRQTPLPSSH